MINVGRIVNSKKLAQPKPFKVYREIGRWVAGRFVEVDKKILNFSGTITACNPQDLIQVPEGDRVTGVMCFYSTQEIFTTRKDGEIQATSDEIEWQGDRYRIVSVVPWNDFGYWEAFGVRKVST